MVARASSLRRVRDAFSSSGRQARSVERQRSASGLVLPDFLGIGAQKAGTTWLAANLRSHPELYVSKPAELHFFDQHFADGLEEYSRFFIPGAGRIKGEITPAYGILPVERVQFIRDVMPDVRLVFVMRNPIERAWSQAMMSLVYNAGRRLEDVDETELLEHLGSRHNMRRGDYVHTLDTWLSVFPREQLFLGFFEDVRERPQELLAEIFEFLGVTSAVDWNRFPYERVFRPGSKERSPGESPPIPESCHRFLCARYADQLAELRDRFGARTAGWS
jgi:hypothetical protein